MRKKTRAEPTMQKHQKIYPAVLCAESPAYPTGCAPPVSITTVEPLRLKPNKIIIGVDVMGSDHPPSLLLEAIATLTPPPGVSLLVLGPPDYREPFPHAYHPTYEAISLSEHPLTALRRKKEASLCVGLRLLKAGAIHAFVSAGNTGALVTASKMILSMQPHLMRPALLALMPTKKRPVAVLDVGANVQVKAAHLIQFAYMAAAYLASHGISHPSIGILNIGSEPLKGTSELRLAYPQLQSLKAPFHFAGNIEGTSVFDGNVDALITDGFTGNVFLKTAEGIASLILDRIQAAFPGNALSQIGAKIGDLHQHLHYAEYPGALLLGVRGIVIKCHSYSTPQAFINGVKGAIDLTQSHFMDRFQKHLQRSFR